MKTASSYNHLKCRNRTCGVINKKPTEVPVVDKKGNQHIRLNCTVCGSFLRFAPIITNNSDYKTVQKHPRFWSMSRVDLIKRILILEDILVNK